MQRIFQYIILLAVMAGSIRLHAQLPAVFTFDSQSKYTSGYNFTVTDQWSYYVVISLGGALTVKAAGDLINGANSIPVNNIKLQLSSLRNGGVNINLGGTNSQVTLSTTAATFYSGLSVSLLSTIYFSFNYLTAGGAAFLNKPAGTYSTTLTFATGSTTLATATLSVAINNVGSITASNVTLNFNTATAYKSGLQINQTNLLNTIFSNQPYKILVKAQATNITNGVNTIPVSNLSAVIDPATAVALSTTNQTLSPLAGTITPTIAVQQYTVKFITDALNAVFINKPPGNYTVTLIFSLADASGSAYPASLPATASIILTITLSNTAALTLGSGADNAQLSFSTANDYKLGTSLTQNNAINIFSNNPYTITVKAATAQLTYLSNNIPVNNVYVLATPSTSAPSITTSAIALSSLPQTIANASTAGLGTFSQNFNLKYYTQPLNSAFINRPPGAYNTTLTFTVTEP